MREECIVQEFYKVTFSEYNEENHFDSQKEKKNNCVILK